MLRVTNKASEELKKVLDSDAQKNKNLILYFMGAGWSGPSLGMALDESTEGLEAVSSNNITAYIDPKLKDYLSQIGEINIDFVTNETGSGYTIKIGDADCGQGGCEGCGWYN